MKLKLEIYLTFLKIKFIIYVFLITEFASAQIPLDATNSGIELTNNLSTKKIIELSGNSNWTLKQFNKNESERIASVPGCVQTDFYSFETLYKNPDTAAWIEKKIWEYNTEFKADEFLEGNLKKENKINSYELVFEKLDLIAQIYLNDTFVTEVNNAFISHRINVTKLIHAGNLNKLRIIFQKHYNNNLYDSSTAKLRLFGERVFERKAQYEFGWDWAPKFITVGIKKPIYLIERSIKSAEITNMQITHANLTDTSAMVFFNINIHSNCKQNVYIHLTLANKYISVPFSLQFGENEFHYNYQLNNIENWNPRGYGKQTFYDGIAWVFSKHPLARKTVLLDKKFVPHAFCDSKLVQEKDSAGTSFYFNLNGRNVFAKGVNLVPYDSFDEFYNDSRLNNIYELNANMIRVWGGGYYLDDAFYRYCLANGILIWQDFMFACAMYPGNKDFLANVKTEVKQQIQKLSNYQNIVLLCGNNEIDEGWKNWGWQKQFMLSKKDSTKMYNNYISIFEKTIPEILSENNWNVSYVSSSPKNGWGRKESLTEGDCHYWGVWWGMQPIDTLNTKIPRFMSEYGMQSMPSMNLLEKFVDFKSVDIDLKILNQYQKHPTGFQNLNGYLNKYYSTPTNIFNYVYATQLVQALTYKTAIEAHRRNMPYCMGSVLWQMNDCWPSISWSLVDYFQNRKVAWNQVKESFQTIVTSIIQNENKIEIHIVSDSLNSFTDTLLITLYNFEGKVVNNWAKFISVNSQSSILAEELDLKQIGSGDLLSMYYLVTTLKNTKSIGYFTFKKPNQLALLTPKLIGEIQQVNNNCGENCGYYFYLKTNVHCPDIAYYPKDENHQLIYKNFIDPDHPLQIHFYKEDYEFYKSLCIKPNEKFFWLEKILRKH